MDQVTQQNAAMVEQSTAASHSLADEASELARLVGQFQIGQLAEIRAAKSPARRRAAGSARRPRGAGAKVVALSRQNGAPRAALAGAQENWDEF